ncbi:antigenic cell wall galactomannoprotein [Beauveria brongniartii RCEF 3172]|uniref:Antigenic cell wall galactomannoprotein n=1 Tax=Beauveria brongniartii RCEF 3172 TaxID=1081107 RepID=A0A167DKW1_9HYPO|nr:antigenic cell wall galactomannoprotein [Beauveria brongniartii RCEF 3172]
MQIKLLTLAALATTAVADIKGCLETIAASTVQLDKSVTSYQGGLLGLVPITTDALCLLNDINQCTSTARASAPLDYEAALDIAGATGTLADNVNTVIDDLVRAKPKFDRLLIVTPIIKVTVEQEREATKELCKQILAKIPKELADIAAILIKQIDDKFAEGIKAFS